MSEWNSETAEWYAEKFGEYPTNRLAVDAIELDASAIVVDVGCGTGAALRHAAKVVTTGKLVGVDPVPRMIEIAQDRTSRHFARKRIQYHVGLAESLPVDDSTADVVLAFDSMDHWHDRVQGLLEVKRILRAEGRYVVVKDGGLPDSRAAREGLSQELENAGLRVVAHEEVKGDGIRFGFWMCKVSS